VSPGIAGCDGGRPIGASESWATATRTTKAYAKGSDVRTEVDEHGIVQS
jgi:hypothetical protein